jgi:hypothetical protein
MLTLVVDAPHLEESIDHLDFEPLTAVYVAPQACTGAGIGCNHFADTCCPGLTCVGPSGGGICIHII